MYMTTSMYYKRFICFIALFIFFTVSGNAIPEYYFKQISLQEGLSQSTVYCMLKDNKGMIWIGTKFGLNRYNQSEVKSYYNEINNNRSLPGNYIYFIAEDSLKNIWIGTDRGLATYNRETDDFTTVTFEKQRINPQSFVTMHDRILFGESGRLFSFDYKSEKLSMLEATDNPIKNEMINNLALWRSGESEYTGKVIITCKWKGMWLFDLQDQTLKKISSINESNISSSYIDSSDRIWVAPYGQGLKCYSKEGKLIHQFSTSNSGLSNNVVLRMIEKNNQLWIATDGGGLSVLDLNNFSFRVIEHRPGDPYSIPVNSIVSLYNDDEDYMWAGSIRNGLIGIKEIYIKTYKEAPLNTPYGLSDKTVTSLFEDPSGIIWIGTDGGGINRFDSTNKTFKHYPSTYGNKIISLSQYSNNELVCSVFSKGLFLFDKRNGSFRKLEIWNATESNRIFNSGYSVNIALLDKENLLLLADTPYFYNFKSKKVEILPSVNQEVGIWYPQKFYFNEKQTHLIAGNSIIEIDNRQKTIRTLIWLPDSIRNIEAFCKDDENYFWIGTSNNGLFQINATTKKIKKIQTQLFSGVTSLTSDSNGRIWVGTHNSLFAYLPSENKFVAFGESDGVYANEYVNKSTLLTRSGDLFIGGVNGLVQIKNTIPFNDFPEPVISLMSVELDGAICNIEEGENTLSIPWNYSTLSLNVIAQEKDPMRKKIFRYEIIGESHELISSQSNSLTLHTLPSGKYRIMASCLGRDGNWSAPVEVLNLHVKGPWWKSGWFTALYLLFFVTLAYVLFRYSILRKENKLKWKLKEQEQLIYEEKISFLINISHELRTPLTLIYAPLKRMLDKSNLEETVSSQLSSIYKQVHKMKNTINMVLDAHKMDEGQNSLSLKQHDLNNWIVSIADDFRMEYKSSGIELSYDLDPTVGCISFDEVKIEIVLSNLLINALKFSESGTKTIVSTQKKDNSVRISITDEGIGLNNVDPNKLFNRLYQGVHDRSGSGIGLSYAKALVNMHGGFIGAENNPSKGATFFIELPLSLKETQVISNKTGMMNEFIFNSSEDKAPVITDSFELNKYTILIVEDEPDLRNYLKQTLKEYFNQVYVAENGVSALSIIAQKHPDIIASDVMMPQMDGFELCKKIKEDIEISHIPVILLTALSGQESSDLGYKLGADVYISKPFEIDLLVAVAKNIIRGRELTKIRHKETSVVISPIESTYSNADEKFMINLNALINKNLSNSTLDVQFIADNLAMSRASIYNKMKELVGIGIKDYINKIRLTEATHLLVNTDLTIMEIADKTGFSNQQYFSTVFKQAYGTSPSKYRSEQTGMNEKNES